MLFRLADGRQLDSCDVVCLIKAFASNCSPYDCFSEALDALDSLEPGLHISPDGVLDLFDFCADG